MGRRALLAIVLTTGALSPATASADDFVPTEQVFAEVNAQRAAAGVPPVEVDPEMTQGCRNHVDYLHLNGTGEFHDETPGNPGYTEIGEKAAQRSNGGFDFFAPTSPFYSAPAHRWGFLDPRPLRAGLAQRREGDVSFTCQWYSNYDDEERRVLRPAPEPRAWTIPVDGATGVSTWERASEAPQSPAHDLGLETDPSKLYTSGWNIFFYHDDLPDPEQPEFPIIMHAVCRGALLGPGGQPVAAPMLVRGIMVPVEPFLPGGIYTTHATYSDGLNDYSKPTESNCTDTQRTASSTFTTAPRKPIEEMLGLSDIYMRDGKAWFDTTIDEVLRLEQGQIRFDFTGVYDPFTYDLDDWWKGGRPPQDLTTIEPGQTVTVTLRSPLVTLGPVCWTPATVTRAYTRTTSGYEAGPQSFVVDSPDPCAAPPTPSRPKPARGASGTVVKIGGAGVGDATSITFGGIEASAWRMRGAGVAVTVPARAKSGPLQVTTPTGTAVAAKFRVPRKDAVAPETRIDLAPEPAGSARAAHVVFTSTEGAGSFRCRLDRGKPKRCKSPWTAADLENGRHRLEISARDQAGNTDSTPAVVTWKVAGNG